MSDTVQDLEKGVLINVRSPSLNETLAVTITLKSTVLSLKESIKPIHPHHPAAENQRIIYSGKLLQDSELLSDIIKSVDDEVTPTLHLVVKPSLQNLKPQTQQQSSTTTIPQPSNVSMPSTSTSSIPLPEPLINNINNINPLLQNNNINVPAYPSVLPGGYQVVVINGNYYLAPVLVPSQPLPHFQQHQFQQNTQFISPPFYQQQYQPQTPQFQPPQYQQGQPQAQQQQEPIIQPYLNFIPPQNNNVNPAVGGGGAPVLVRPANAQRAASIWLALKLVVVLFMLCQGASIERIIIFHAIAFIFFLYQTGRLRFVLRRVRVEDLNNRFRGNINMAQRAPPPVPIQTPQQQNDNAQGASTSVNNNNNADNLNQRRPNNGDDQQNATSSASSSTPERPRTPPTFLEACKRGAFTFFASLWPTYGQDPRIAQAFENNNDQREGLEEF